VVCRAPAEKLAPEAGDPKLEPEAGRDSQLDVAPVAGLPNEGFPALAKDENDDPPAACAANPPALVGAGDAAEAPKAGAELAAPKPPKAGLELAPPKPPKPPIALELPNAAAGLALKEKLGVAPVAPPPTLSDPSGGGEAPEPANASSSCIQRKASFASFASRTISPVWPSCSQESCSLVAWSPAETLWMEPGRSTPLGAWPSLSE
jgi:hypothetical protein